MEKMKGEKMRMERKFKSWKFGKSGITLIALVITIIVLMILAGVTINLTLGDNGIFKTAEQAARNYKDAEEKELGLLESFTNSVDKTVNDLQYELLKSKAKPGDYVQYDGGNGYTGLWQILYNDSVYGLQIISADIVKEFGLGGTTEEAAKISYNNAVDVLNEECKKYINISFAKSEDSARCVGSNPLNPVDSTTEYITFPYEYKGSQESGMKVADTNYLADLRAIASNSNLQLDKNCWLASRSLDNVASYSDFLIRTLRNDKDSRSDIWFVYPNNTSFPKNPSSGLRPVVILSDDIKISNGIGSKERAFELVEKVKF